ncbi:MULTISPECIES: bifunctional 3-(3-hydroxy-phenyl)propionate/3-hydroxycinnamic acid hydroxylase [unclassified Streptomyces]|uniref:bifunctional 3-(3-hydroxy-phenyl)propionate/3-hydroxycinnamic acid hydroxylase MhpA n=1 Tax=unclassified Streptomyces TaxID=2593676 RepID=UPI00381EEFBA
MTSDTPAGPGPSRPATPPPSTPAALTSTDPEDPNGPGEDTTGPEVVPVVIVGAGPVGVTAALLLARYGVRTVVLERHPEPYPLPRAVAADDEVCRILQAAGVDEEFTRISRVSRGLRLLDAAHRVIAEFPRSPSGRHGFPQTSMFDQPALEGLLRAALARRPEAELRTGAEVTAVEQDTDGPVRITYRDPHGGQHLLRAEAVLGCDGAGSLVRETVGARWEDLRFEETWTVVDIRTTAPVRCWEGVDQVCDPHRPATFMRVGEDRYRWEFRLPGGPTGPDLDETGLRALVAPWTDPTHGSPGSTAHSSPRGTTHGSPGGGEIPYGCPDFEILRQSRYTFRARVADRWRRGRVFLLGDAAHLTPPFVGQGLCAGLRDAHNLAWKLARVLRQGAHEALLDTYEQERRPHARHVVRLAVATGWAMTGGQDRAAALRRTAVTAAARIPGVTARAARDLSPALRAGPLVQRRTGHPRGLPGTSAPQPWARTGAGDRVRLDQLLGDSFAVLTAVPPTPSLRALAAALGARIVPVTDTGDDGTLAAWLRAGRADAALLRPDRVVMDVVPRGAADFTGATAWAPLLTSGRRRTEAPARPDRTPGRADPTPDHRTPGPRPPAATRHRLPSPATRSSAP